MVRSLVLSLLLCTLCAPVSAQETEGWTGTWASAAEYASEGDMPATRLAGNTLRQVVQVSIGGDRLRLQLSNEFSDEPLQIRAVYIADAADSSAICRRSARHLRFGGRRSVTIAPGQSLWSDVLRYSLRPLQRLSVTICYGEQVPTHATTHRGSRTTSYIALGQRGARSPFRSTERVEHWYNITKIEVPSHGRCAVAVLGNSITDGRGSTTDGQDRWPDAMAQALSSDQCGVLNLGIGGNCVIQGGISQPALERFQRDILGQSGVETLIIFQGTNDIGTSTDASQTAQHLIQAYQQMASQAREAGIRHVVGATITPFKGNAWHSPAHEAARQRVNEWIRSTRTFDGVIDFDHLVRDSHDPERLQQCYSSDGLHLNPAGYRVMGYYAARRLSTLKGCSPDRQ